MRIKSRDITLHTQVPDRPGLHVLGVFESRVTVYSQQVRALNLIYSLAKLGRIKKSTKVAVIGAGVAGLTVAAAAACCEADVTVLEQLSEPLALFGQSTKRWLHPHVYEWPKEDESLPHPLDDDAGLPLMNWQADTVNRVREQLRDQYNEFQTKFNIDLKTQVSDVAILPGNNRQFSLTWNGPSNRYAGRRNRTRQFDIVILAIGFGLERTAEGIPFLSYWSNDKLDEEDASIHGRPKRILVSGTGDGGLIDLIRSRFKGFSHHNLVARLTRELIDQPTLEWLTARLIAIEDEAERSEDEQKLYQARLNEEYQNLSEELISRVDLLSRIGIRSDTQAVLTGRDDYPLSLGTSILNRLLYSILPDVKYLKGPWTSQRNVDGSIKVTFADKTTEDFDELIIRHGPEAALKKDFPDIWEQCAQLRARSILDQTRYPIYGEFFDVCLPSNSTKVRVIGEAAEYPESTVVTPQAKSETFGSETRLALPSPFIPTSPIKLNPRIIGSIPTDISQFTGREDLIKTLSMFLRADGSGVCTLLGMGGCGKSALLKKFGKVESLFSPPNTRSPQDAVFSWSFYQDDRLNHFFTELSEYIALLSPDYNRPKDPVAHSNPLILPDIINQSGKRVVLLLDGLERVIDEGRSQKVKEGSITTPALKALLQRASENECGSLRIFITTRVPVPEIANTDNESSLTLDLNMMGEGEAIALLERSGARGEREQLARAAREFKLHAYSLSLLGKALAEEYRGDIRSRDYLITSGSESEIPIGRILVWYINHLNEYSLCLLKAISIYRGTVSETDLKPVLSAVTKKEHYEGLNWTTGQYVQTRSRLTRLGLIFVSDKSRATGDKTLDLHPIVRAYFYNLLVEPADLHERALEILSAAAPERLPADAKSIAVLIEMIHQAVQSQKYELAWTIYLERLGGYHNIGYQRADHPLGSRIIYTFLNDSSFANAEISDSIRTNLFMDGGLYLKNEGRLDDAIDLLNSIRPSSKINSLEPDQFVSLLLVKAGIEIMRGRIPAAKKSIANAQTEFNKIRKLLNQRVSSRIEKECLSRLATALAISADPKAAELFERAAKIPDHPETVPHDHLPIAYGWYLMLSGNYEKAREVLRSGLEIPIRLGAKMLKYRVQSMQVLNEVADHDLGAAESILDDITAWTLRPDPHVFTLTWLMRAKIALAKKDYPEVRTIATRGLKYAGNNGYALEWLDLVLILSEVAIFTKNYDEANRLAHLVIIGDDTSYTYSMPGSSSEDVNYVWTSLPAIYIKALSDQRRSKALIGENIELENARMALLQLGHPFMEKMAELEQR